MEFPLILPLVTLILLWLLLGVISAWVYPLMSVMTQNLRPDLRSLFQLVYAMLPLVIAAAVAILVFTPVLGGFYLSTHCHDVICNPHVPVLSIGSFSGNLITTGLSGGILTATGALAFLVWKNSQAVTGLSRFARNNSHPCFRILDTHEILACNVGVFGPKIMVSRGLLELTSPEQLRVIVTHELAHGYRLDNLRRFLVTVMTLAFPQSYRDHLLYDMELASEQSCDRYAVLITEMRNVVVETIQAVDLWKGQSGDAGCSLVSARINALSKIDDLAIDGWKPAAMMFMASIIFILLAGDVFHRVAESLFSVAIY